VCPACRVGWAPSELEPQQQQQQVPPATYQQHPQQQDHHHLQQQQSGSQQVRQQPQQGPLGRPPWVGPRDTPAAAKGDKDSSSCKSSSSRRVSRASSGTGGGGARSGARNSSGGVQAQPAAAVFHSQELAQLAATAAEKVGGRRGYSGVTQWCKAAVVQSTFVHCQPPREKDCGKERRGQRWTSRILLSLKPCRTLQIHQQHPMNPSVL
jgi:hypothetical protein